MISPLSHLQETRVSPVDLSGEGSSQDLLHLCGVGRGNSDGGRGTFFPSGVTHLGEGYRGLVGMIER